MQEHGLGSDVSLKDPDRTVSSFALQLKYGQDSSLELLSCDPRKIEKDSGNIEEKSSVHRLQELPDLEFKHLGNTFKELGHYMLELGLRLARVCDKAIGGGELEQSIIDSCTAKGRLIHYHSMVDNLILKEGIRKTNGTIKKTRPVTCISSVSTESKTSANKLVPEWGRVALDEQPKLEDLCTETVEHRCWRTSISNLWQQWHYDYGIFTVLTAPWFISSIPMEDCTCISNSQPCFSPDEHTYLLLFDATENKIRLVKSSPENFIIQVGEAADILSGGRLCATLHSVGKPIEIEDLSRETFAVFLQPAWSRTLSYPEHLNARTSQAALPSSKETCSSKSQQLIQEILRKVPPLSSRLRDGMTFAEFSRETTKQYYGGSGVQSRDK